ncbi:MAG TPA: peptidoglycan-binding protein [Syntrophomonadaceae bacterium]|nr:peptidoglycan-binding protein [Syntrophomonadaceae bacterium]
MPRSKLLISLFIFCFVLIVLAPEAKAAENSKGSKNNVIIVNRTDYPILWFNNPCLGGEAVWMLQARLKELGYDIEPTGIFAADTYELVKLFQIANGMSATGIVSQPVWEALMYGEQGQTCLTGSSPAGNVMIEIDIAKHKLTLFEDGQMVKEYPVGVGKGSTPSPLGEWKVIQKSLQWGNGFGTRWMGLNVPWGIYGIHGTDKPYSIGASMSHGCIRMLNRHVEDLYPRVPAGTRVRIVENGKMFPGNFRPRKLKLKSYGQDVVYVQSQLKELGVVFDNADGRFGIMTELAVKYYQVWHGLEPTGVVDADTYRSMGMISTKSS